MSRCCFASNSGATSRRPVYDGFCSVGESALQGISSAAGQSLILILSDINMRSMSGLEMLPKAKAARPDVPVIMITAYGDDSTKRKALDGEPMRI
jgi:CheY-like chemotaxis protein